MPYRHVLNKDTVNNEYYTCPVYNYLIANGQMKIGIYEICSDDMHGLGTPSDLYKFLATKKLPSSLSSPQSFT